MLKRRNLCEWNFRSMFLFCSKLMDICILSVQFLIACESPKESRRCCFEKGRRLEITKLNYPHPGSQQQSTRQSTYPGQRLHGDNQNPMILNMESQHDQDEITVTYCIPRAVARQRKKISRNRKDVHCSCTSVPNHHTDTWLIYSVPFFPSRFLQLKLLTCPSVTSGALSVLAVQTNRLFNCRTVRKSPTRSDWNGRFGSIWCEKCVWSIFNG